MTQASYRAVLGPEPELTPSDAKRSDRFEYDALGNRSGAAHVASRGPMTFTRRDNGLNQYLTWSPMPMVYDDNWAPSWVPPGNGVTMGDGYITASYNALHQPMAMGSTSLGGNFYWSWHDPLGRCVKRWLGNGNGVMTGPITYFYYDGWNLVQEGPNASTADRLYVHGGRVDEIVASQVGGQWYNHHYDARGHCILLTTATGGLEQQYDYDAFGLPYFYTATGSKLNSSAVKTRFLFTGREWLSDLRVYDYRNRMYQPELGRFLQPDPKQFEAGDYNLYRYCHNDPVNKCDPMGLDPDLIAGMAENLTPVANTVVQHFSDYQATYSAMALIGLSAWAQSAFSGRPHFPTTTSPGYRYVGRREAAMINRGRVIPKVDKYNQPKPVFYTDEKFESGAAAEKALSLASIP